MDKLVAPIANHSHGIGHGHLVVTVTTEHRIALLDRRFLPQNREYRPANDFGVIRSGNLKSIHYTGVYIQKTDHGSSGFMMTILLIGRANDQGRSYAVLVEIGSASGKRWSIVGGVDHECLICHAGCF